MRSDAPAVSSKAEAFSPTWFRYASIAIVCLLLGTMLWPFWRNAGEGAKNIGVTPACASWDDLARDSIARFVQNSKRDADLRLAGDAIFRLRRARRNCDIGWRMLACQDYLFVVRGISGTSPSRLPREPACTTAIAEGTRVNR
jgi:hypothetical protein